jgi:uncharacterized MAPEG superfamily protein
MRPELWVLAASIVLGLVHVILAAHTASIQRGYMWTAGSRDAPVEPLSGLAGRLERARRNFAETFPMFAAATLLVHAVGVSNQITMYSAYAYIGGRLVYLILYAAGTFLVRSLVWNVSTLSIVAMLLALF